MEEYRSTQTAYDTYVFEGNTYGDWFRKISKSNFIDNGIDALFSKLRLRTPPKRPAAFTGYWFNRTIPTGGYGKATRA